MTDTRFTNGEVAFGTSHAGLSCTLVVLLAIAVALVSTTGIGIAVSWFDEQRIILLVVLWFAALFSWLAGPSYDGRQTLVLLAALSIGLLSSLLAPRPYVASLDWSVYCLIASLVLRARSSSASAIATTAAVLAVVVSAPYVAGVVANYVSSMLLDFPVGAETLLVGFSNPRFPAQLQVLTIPLLPLAVQRLPTTFWRACLVSVAALWWMCFIGSGSRTGWLAIAVATTVVSFLGIEGRRWLKWQAAFAVLGALLWVLLFHWVPALLSVASLPETGRLSDFTSVGARWELWRLSAEAAFAHPLFGLGPMHFSYVNNGLGAHPHNFWLQLAAEWGIAAALLIGSVALTLVASLVRTLRRELEPDIRWVGVALLTAVVAWGIGTLSDGYMVIPTSQVLSTAVLMLAVMWVRLSQPAASVVLSGKFPAILSLVLCVVALSVLAALPATGFGQPTKRELAWRAEHAGDWLWPRFWQQGWIGPSEDPTAREDRAPPSPQKLHAL